jgi:hypothetical protein
VSGWKQLTLPNPFNSWAVERFDKYVLTVEVFRFLFKTAQLANSHKSTSDKGQLRALFT